VAWLAGVFIHERVQREHRSLEHCFDDDNGRRIPLLPSLACAERVLHAYLSASPIPRVLCVHLMTSRRLSPFAPAQPPQLRCISIVERQHVPPHARYRPTGRLRAPCTELTRRGSGLMRRGLLASVWLGSQAFAVATAFNANIGAWNTASMTSMGDVFPYCHRQRVLSLRFMLACLLRSFLDYMSLLTARSLPPACAQPPQLPRISKLER
jgi:hypothetical protein